MSEGLAGRVIVVTGGGRGMGAAISSRLVSAGARVAILDVGAAAETAAALGGDTLGLECDVSDPESVDRAVEAVDARFGGCDGLVNNAGIVLTGPLEDLDVDDWRSVVAVNLGGCFLCTQRFGRLMLRAQRGAIVNIASIAATSPASRAGAYSATKAGIVSLTGQTALEWADRGIRANVILPGTMELGMGGGRLMGRAAAQEALIPLGRVGKYAEIAEVAAFLLDDRASYVTGAAIAVDGGLALAILREQQSR